MHNDSAATVSGAVVTDDLSAGVEQRHVGGSRSSPDATITGTTLTWNVPTIAAGGADATVSYTVTVNAGAYNKMLTNVATPGPGGECATAADCTTDHFDAALHAVEVVGSGVGVDGEPG